jgi:hypothetical protein
MPSAAVTKIIRRNSIRKQHVPQYHPVVSNWVQSTTFNHSSSKIRTNLGQINPNFLSGHDDLSPKVWSPFAKGFDMLSCP